MSSDWDIFHKAQDGDRSAWREMIAKFQPGLTTFILLLTGSAASTEDIVQDTFIRALKTRINNHRGTVKGLLNTIAYRLALKELEKSNRHETIEKHEFADPNESSLDSIISNERHRLVAESIHELDDRHRNVLVLRFYGEYSYQQIAEMMELSIGTVKSRIYYAVKNCREILKRKGITE